MYVHCKLEPLKSIIVDVFDKGLPMLFVCRYDVPIGNITRVTDVWGNIGTGGTHQVIYYCEVSDDMLVSGSGGGNPSEGEMIEVIYVPVSELMEFLVDSDKKKSVGSCFGIMWFLHQKKKQ